MELSEHKKSLVNFIILLFVLGTSISCNMKKTSHKSIDTTQLNIMAYYVPGKDIKEEQLPLNKLTHIIFSFSKVVDGEMHFSNQTSDERLKHLLAQKSKYPALNVMVACGGWGADGFSDAALTAESRQKFVKSAIAFIEKYQLDGMDIDWEYPGISGAGTKARPDEDKENFTALMKLLRSELNKLPRPQTLTFAAAGWKRYYDYVDLNEVMKYADYINVMTYDQAGGGSPFTGHHTALGNVSVNDIVDTPLGKAMKKRNKNLPGDVFPWEPQSAEKIIEFCENKGVKPSQIVIGAAFYGRGWKGVPPENNGLYQANKGPISGGTNYHSILTNFTRENGFTKHWDSLAKAPYLYNSADSIFVTYDDTKSVQLKTKFAKNKKLGGIMFWQLGGDSNDEKSLLNAIFEESVR